MDGLRACRRTGPLGKSAVIPNGSRTLGVGPPRLPNLHANFFVAPAKAGVQTFVLFVVRLNTARSFDGRCRINSELALRLSKVLGRTSESWLTRQTVNLDALKKVKFRVA